MMKEQFDVRQGYRVFNKVLNHGERSGEEHLLHGLRVSSDFDGYTLRLQDEFVDAYIYFHNSFKLEYGNDKALQNFLHRMQKIDDTEYPSRFG